MAVIQLKDGRWICYYRRRGPDGKSQVKKEYFGRGAQAEAAAKKRHQDLNLKIRRPARHDTGPTVAELAKSYGINKHFSANSSKHLKIRLQSNILPFFGHKLAIHLTDQDLDNYIHKRRRDPIRNRAGKVIRIGVKNATIARELTDLQAILNWSTRRRPALIRFNPVRDYIKPKQDNAIITPPTAEETELIIKHASPHIMRAIKLSYYIGLRPGAVELLDITWADVNWSAATILVRSADKGGPRMRHVALHNDFIDELRQWYAADNKSGPVIHYRGRAIQKIGKAWQGTLKRAGITRRIRPYDLRHNFITQALEAGADIKALSQIVGSRPETIMRHYQHVSKKLHRDTVAKIPPLGIRKYPQKKGPEENE